MDDNKLIDGAEIITLDEIKHLKLPYFEGLAAGYPSQGTKGSGTLAPKNQIARYSICIEIDFLFCISKSPTKFAHA